MKPARCGLAAGLCRPDAATWPAPATEAPRLRSGRSPPYHLRTSPSGAPGAGVNEDAFPFSRAGENLSRVEGILRVRLSETRDSDARASRVTAKVASARCSLLTRLVLVLRQADGHCEHRPGSVRCGHGRESQQTVSYASGVRPASGSVTCLSVRARTVGDFFAAAQFIGGRRRPVFRERRPMKFRRCCALIR